MLGSKRKANNIYFAFLKVVEVFNFDFVNRSAPPKGTYGQPITKMLFRIKFVINYGIKVFNEMQIFYTILLF